MKTYGASKHETVECKYGCCGGSLRPLAHNNERYARNARKRERQNAKREAKNEQY